MEKMKDIMKRMEDTVCAELAKGVENIDAKELGEAVDVIKDMAEAMYYKSVVDAMEESKEEEKLMQKMGMPEEEARYYRGQPRNAMGQFKADGRPNRRRYNPVTEPEMYSMDMYMPEDMRKRPMMYYDGGNSNMGMNNGTNGGNMSRNYDEGYRRGYDEGMRNAPNRERDSREGRAGQSRRRYMESQQNHSDNTPQDKEQKLRDLEEYLNDLSNDITDLISKMTPEEKTTLRNKMNNLAARI